MSKKNFIIIIAAVLLSGSLYLARATSAQENSGKTFIQTIAEKFNLKQDDVQEVADQYHSQKMETMQAERRNRLEERLTEAVADGELTQNQKQAILEKHDELQQKREQERADMEKWAEQNGLDDNGIGFGLGMFKFGRGMHFWK